MSNITLSKPVAALSEKLLPVFDIDKESGGTELKPNWEVLTGEGAPPVAEQVYNHFLPEGVTPELLKTIATHDAHFVAASVDAFGRASASVLGDNRNINQTNVDIPFGYKGNVHINVLGERELGEGKGSAFGDVKVVITTHAGEGGAQLNKAMKSVAAACSAALGVDSVDDAEVLSVD